MILMPMSCEKCHSFVHTSRSHLLHFSSAFVWRFSPFCDAWWATAVMLGLCDTYRYKTAHLGGGENALKHDSLSRSLVYEVISLAHGTGRSLNYLAKIFVLNFEKGNNLGTPQGSAHPKNSVSTIFNICQLFSTFFNTCRNLGRIPLSPRSEFCWIVLNFAESAWRFPWGLPWGLPRAVPPKTVPNLNRSHHHHDIRSWLMPWSLGLLFIGNNEPIINSHFNNHVCRIDM